MELPCELNVEYFAAARQTGRYTKVNLQIMKDNWNDYVLFIPPKSRKQCFQIAGNVEKIYNNFEDQGKCSVQFHQPPVLVLIRNGDPVQVKKFVRAINNLGTDKTYDLEHEMDKEKENDYLDNQT